MFRSLSGDRSIRRFVFKRLPIQTGPKTIPLNKQWSKGSAKKEKEKRYG